MLFYSFYALSVFLAWVYVFLICYIIKQWNTSMDVSVHKNLSLKTTVIVVARNEAENIFDCLSSIFNNDYPQNLLEVILVDDHSEDDTIKIAKQFERLRILHLGDYIKKEATNNFKKEALSYAIEQSNGEVILCTDADCIVPKKWVQHHASSFLEGYNFSAAPVSFSPRDSKLNKFEALDILGMMGVTAAGIYSNNWFMANGANMSFSKDIYNQLNPYKENKIASGDDIKLVQAISKIKLPIQFIKNKEAVVMSKSNSSISSFIQQRIRWGSKNKGYTSLSYTIIMLIPFALSLITLLLPIFIVIDPINAILTLTSVLFCKLGIDYFYLKTLADFYDDQKLLKPFFPSALMHVIYISIIGIISLVISKYNWKGRTVN